MEKEITELLDDKIRLFHKLEDTLDECVDSDNRDFVMDMVCELVNTQKHIDRIMQKQKEVE